MAVQHLAILLPVVGVGTEGRLERDQIAKEHTLLWAQLRSQEEVSLLWNRLRNVSGNRGLLLVCK